MIYLISTIFTIFKATLRVPTPPPPLTHWAVTIALVPSKSSYWKGSSISWNRVTKGIILRKLLFLINNNTEKPYRNTWLRSEDHEPDRFGQNRFIASRTEEKAVYQISLQCVRWFLRFCVQNETFINRYLQKYIKYNYK